VLTKSARRSIRALRLSLSVADAALATCEASRMLRAKDIQGIALRMQEVITCFRKFAESGSRSAMRYAVPRPDVDRPARRVAAKTVRDCLPLALDEIGESPE
jgi:hypothetical protein